MILTGDAHRAHDRGHRRPHHHLSLRARACRADGPGGRGAPPVRARHHGQGRRRPGAARRGRPRRVRQDRHPHRRRAAVGRRRRRSLQQPGGGRGNGSRRAIPIRRPSPPRAASRRRRRSRWPTSASIRAPVSRRGSAPRSIASAVRFGARCDRGRAARASCCPRTGAAVPLLLRGRLRGRRGRGRRGAEGQGHARRDRVRRSRGAGAPRRLVARRAVPRRRARRRRRSPASPRLQRRAARS